MRRVKIQILAVATAGYGPDLGNICYGLVSGSWNFCGGFRLRSNGGAVVTLRGDMGMEMAMVKLLVL